MTRTHAAGDLARMRTTLAIVLGVSFLSLPACAGHHEAGEAEKPAEATAEKPKFTMGNGEKNAIVVDGVTRSGATFTFAEVTIDGAGWLVLHPFKDGRPDGSIYVAHTYVADGTSRDVAISLAEEPAPGTKFLVMLHSDVDGDQEFDFNFLPDGNVEDKAVFEGSQMIAHAIATPE